MLLPVPCQACGLLLPQLVSCNIQHSGLNLESSALLASIDNHTWTHAGQGHHCRHSATVALTSPLQNCTQNPYLCILHEKVACLVTYHRMNWLHCLLSHVLLVFLWLRENIHTCVGLLHFSYYCLSKCWEMDPCANVISGWELPVELDSAILTFRLGPHHNLINKQWNTTTHKRDGKNKFKTSWMLLQTFIMVLVATCTVH